MEMDADRRNYVYGNHKEVYGNLNPLPERIIYKYRRLGEFPFNEGLTPESFIDYFNENVNRILYVHRNESPTNISVDLCIEDNTVFYNLYGNTIESLVDYEHRMAALKEAQEAWERKQISKAEHDKWYKDLELQAKAVNERESAEVLALSTDPELAEYQRLKAKFKVYDKRSGK